MSETTENTTDVSIRQIVNLTEPVEDAIEVILVLDTCGRMWRGYFTWKDCKPTATYCRVNAPQVPADPPPADTVAQLRAELTLSEYRYEALLKERDQLRDELDACNEFLSRES
jgi:hypothetical protein